VIENPRIIFFGTPEFAVAILKTLIDEQYNVVAAVSQPDRPVGRKHVLTPTPVHALCTEHGIPCLQPEKLKEAKEEIASLKPDLILTCAYGQFVPQSILSLPSLGCLNIHPSLLPKYRGGAPIQHAVMNGDSETGVCLMEMTKAMDAGRIYVCRHTPIGPDETFGELNQRLIEISCDMLKEALPEYLKGELAGVPQDEDKVVLALNITREEEQVHFASEDLDQIYNHIRGLIDWPVAYGLLEGTRIKFYQVSKEPKENKEEPGKVLGFEDHAMLVSCKGGILKVQVLQMQGKKKMDADAFKNGYAHEVIGKVFD
jgi:methionyl-tRNA formyltransferase